METTEMEKMAHIAIRDGDAEAIKSLLDAGLDPNLPFDQYQRTFTGTLLFAACSAGHTEIVGHLLEAGALTHSSGGGEVVNPLHYEGAANGEIVTLLVAAGCDPNGRDMHGRRHLDCARSLDVAEALIAAGADMTGCNPIHRAAMLGRSRDVVGFIAMGFDPDGRNLNGDTPLLFAAMTGKADACSVLIDAGADIHAKNIKGETPWMMAAGPAMDVLDAAEERTRLAAEVQAPKAASMGRRRI